MNLDLSKDLKKVELQGLKQDFLDLSKDILGINSIDIFMGKVNISFYSYLKYKLSFSRLSKGVPLAYIIKKAAFYKHDFYINKGCLIPRPETEFLIQKIVEDDLMDNIHSVLDIGCGCGNIILSLAKLFPDLEYTGIEINSLAVKAFNRNASHMSLDKSVKIIHGDFLDHGSTFKNKKFDCIVSNPPYVGTLDKKKMSKSVLAYEPKEALFAGRDGLNFIKYIAKSINSLLNKNGRIILEFGESQEEKVISLFKNLSKYCIVEDQYGKKRFFVGNS